MTDQTEMQIPRDILEAAWACVDQYTDPDLVPVIAMALVRERERCARITKDAQAEFENDAAMWMQDGMPGASKNATFMSTAAAIISSRIHHVDK